MESLRSPLVLVITSDAHLAAQIQDVVTADDMACRCVCLAAGRLALARAETQPADVVIVAAPLPDMDPGELFAALRDSPAQAAATFVYVQDASALQGARDAILLAGADDVLTVPASDASIRAKLRLMLRLKDAEDRVRASRARIRSLNAEQAALLRQAEDRYRALAQYASEGVAVATADGVVKYVSATMEKITGWSSQDAEGICIWDIVHRSDRRRLQQAWSELLHSPMAANVVEARIRGKTGWCWLRVVASNQLHIPGVHGVVLNCHDIGDKRRMADALAASQSRYRRFVETTREGIWATDNNERTTFVNERLGEMLGYSPPELLGKPIEDLLLPEDRAGYRSRIKRRARGELETYEQRFVRKDGSLLWALVSASPMLDHANEYGGAFAMLTDITDQKRMDSELREALARFEALIESTPLVAVQGMTRDGTVVLWNRANEVVYGISREQAIGRRVQDLLLDPGDVSDFEASLCRVWDTGQPTPPAEWRVRAADGQWRWVYSTLVPVQSAGAVSCVYCMDVDITDRVEARAALVASEQKLMRLNTELERRVAERTRSLEQAVDDLDAFAYSVSHDLRAPLRAIAGFSRALEEDYKENLPDEARRYLQHIVDSVKRMDRLIHDLLDFSRCSRHAIEVRRLNMAEIVKMALADQDQEAIGRCQVVLGDLPDVYADQALMLQVFDNLISNAIKYSRTREHPRIEVSGQVEGDRVTYRVRDNGVGYDPRYADKLFGVFQRLHNESEFEGTGVGLAIVHRIIHRHGGSVGSESRPEQGATFWVTLPRGEQHAKTDDKTRKGLATHDAT